MSQRMIPLDKVQYEIGTIDLGPKLEQLLQSFSAWMLDYVDTGVFHRHHGFDEDISEELITLWNFLYENNIGIRPSGVEFYVYENDSGTTEESEQSNCSEVVGQK